MVILKDLNYFPLDVESNIYGMTTLEFDDRPSKLLVATLDCQIYCISYCKFKPHTREVEFTYIPNGARIISIGALKRESNDYVIGITHSLAPSVQKSSARISSNYANRELFNEYNRPTTYYLNIYASGSVTSDHFDLDYVAQGCQTIRLRYVPYHLYQTELISIETRTNSESNQKQNVVRRPFWLLSGGDSSIHAFSEDKPYQSFLEVPIEECFPELSNIPSIALWIDVLNVERESETVFERLIALGFEDGSVKLYNSVLSIRSESSKRFVLIKESSFDAYTTIIPSVRLFKVNSTKNCKLKDKMRQSGWNDINETSCKNREQINLLVVSSTESSLIFEDVITCGLESHYELCDSKRLDCAVTSTIGDINIDGCNEIIIGTHGREMMVYQYDSATSQYNLDKVSELNHPIFSMAVLDLTGDSLKEVTILLASGILVLQASIKDVIKICQQRVESLLRFLGKSET